MIQCAGNVIDVEHTVVCVPSACQLDNVLRVSSQRAEWIRSFIISDGHDPTQRAARGRELASLIYHCHDCLPQARGLTHCRMSNLLTAGSQYFDQPLPQLEIDWESSSAHSHFFLERTLARRRNTQFWVSC